MNAAGYRTIAPDLLGLGNSVGPSDVKAYNLQTSLAPTYLALLDALDVKSAAIVGHDFGASLGWAMAFAAPDRVERLMVLSVGYGGECQQAGGWWNEFVSFTRCCLFSH